MTKAPKVQPITWDSGVGRALVIARLRDEEKLRAVQQHIIEKVRRGDHHFTPQEVDLGIGE